MPQQDRIRPAGAVPQHVRQPAGRSSRSSSTSADLHGPFQAMAVGVGAGRKGGREPRQQVEQRAMGGAVSHRGGDDGDRRHRRRLPDRTAPRPRGRGRRARAPSRRSHGRPGYGCGRPTAARADAGCRDARRCGRVPPGHGHGSRAAARLRHHADQAPVRQFQPVAVPQPRGVRQVEQDVRPGYRGQHDPSAMAAVEIDQHPVGCGRAVPGAGWMYDRRLQCHAQKRKYRCAIGSTVAGSQVSSRPSARTS